MTQLSKTQRSYLRKLANPLRQNVHIGRQGLTFEVVEKIGRELDAHELIKVRFLDYQDERTTLTETIVAETGAHLIGLIGNVAILFRQNTDPQRRKVDLPSEE